MLTKMLELLSKNYKRYLTWSLTGFVISVVFYLLLKSEHILLPSIHMCIAMFCGYWFSEAKKEVLTFKSDRIIGYLSFILLFIIISIIFQIIFRYSLGIITQVVCFSTVILLESISEKKQKR